MEKQQEQHEVIEGGRIQFYEDTVVTFMRQLWPKDMFKVCVYAKSMLEIQREKEQQEREARAARRAARQSGKGKTK